MTHRNLFPKPLALFLLGAALWGTPVRAETIVLDDFTFSVGNIPAGATNGILSGRWGIWNAATGTFVQAVTSSLNAGYVDLSSPELSITLNQTTAANFAPGTAMALAIFTDSSADAQDLNFASATHRLVLTDASWVAPSWANNANMVPFSLTSGTVARIGSYQFNGGNELMTLAGIPHPVISSPTEVQGTLDETLSYQITASGNPTAFSASGLPAGLMLDSATGIISGTPLVAGTFPVTVGATNLGGTGEATVTFIIQEGDGQWLSLAYPGARSTYVSGISGTNIVGFYDIQEATNTTRHGFLYNGASWTQLRPTNAVQSEARGISSNRIVGSFTDTNNRRRGYLLQNGTYTFLDYPGSTETRAFGVDGDRIVGEYRDTNSVRRGFLRTGSTWSNLSFPGSVATSARGISGNRIVGRYTDAFGATNGFILEGTNWTRLTLTNPIPFAEDPGLSWNANYVDATSVSGNTVAGELNSSEAGQTASFLYQGGKWQILSVPNRSSLIVYAIEDHRVGGFYRESADADGWQGFVFTLPAPVVTVEDPIQAEMGTPLSLRLTAENAPASFAATNLPPGLSLNPTNGLISGTPAWSGEFLATLSASNGAGLGTKDVTFSVQPLQLRIPAQGNFSRQLSAPGGAATFQASNLPGGLNLSATGLLSGKPTNSGAFTATLTASNSTGVFTSQISFTVFNTNLVVTGRVVTAANTPVPNFPLRLVNPAIEGKIFASATTGANGAFQLTAPADRHYQIVQANFTNANNPPVRFLYPLHVFADWFGTPVDAGDIQTVAVDRTIRVRMVDAYSGEPVTGTNLTRMGVAALSCELFPLADPVAIWLLHQIQIRAQKSFWKLTPSERAGLRSEATRLVMATRYDPSGVNPSEVPINWGFLENAESYELPPDFYSDLEDNWNARTNVVFYQEAEPFRYLAKTNASGLYEVPTAVLGHDPRVNPWYTQSGMPDAEPEPTSALQLKFEAAEAVRGKVIARYRMVYEQGFGRPGYLSNNPLAVDLKVRPAPRIISGNFYRSNGTTPITNGLVFLEQYNGFPSRDFLGTAGRVNSSGGFEFAVPDGSEDDWRITADELNDTQVNAGGWNYFTSARQYFLVSSSNLTGVRLVADQAPVIISIQGGAAGSSFRVNGSNLGSLGEVSLLPAVGSGDEVVIQPIFSELWTRGRGTDFVEFGLPDYLPPGQYRIQYRYPTYADNLVPEKNGFSTTNDTNLFTVTASTNNPTFSVYPGGLARLLIRNADKNIWSLTLSSAGGETRTVQPTAVTANYVELSLPEDLGLENWTVIFPGDRTFGTLMLNDPTPVIDLQPVDQAVAGGATASFAVGASGAPPLAYQWTRDGANLAGATNPFLTITNVRSSHVGDYAVVVSNYANSVVSAVARLTVSEPPRILSQPRGTNLIAGQNLTLAVEAEGSLPLTYQWRKGGTNLGAATNSSLLLNSVAGTDAGTYSVLISNAVGSALSSNAIVTVVSPPQFAVQATNGLRGNLNNEFFYAPAFSGSRAGFSASNLPSWLKLNSGNGVIAGKPTEAGYYRFSLTASNEAGTATLPLALTIPGTRLSLPFSDNFSKVVPNQYLSFNVSSPGSMRITSGVARFDSPADGTNGSTAGLALNLPLTLTNSWDVSADVTLPNGWETPEVEIGMSLDTMFSTNDTLENILARGQEIALVLNRDTEIEGANNIRRSVYVSGADQEDLRATLTNDSATNARLRLVYQTNSRSLRAWVQTNPALPWEAVGEPLNMNPATGGSLAQQWGLSNGSALFLTLTAYAQGGTGGRSISLDNLSVTAPVPPVITSTGSLIGQVGMTLAYTNRATNGPAEFASTNLPAGLVLDPASGVISGVPTAAGLTNLIVTARTPAGLVTRTNPVIVLPAFLSAEAVAGIVNDSNFRHEVLVGAHNFGTNLRFSASNLPAGTAINATSGVILGRPTNAGVYTSLVTISALGATARQNVQFTFPAGQGAGLRLVLNPRPASLTNLPTGLSYVASTGVISGTPTVWGSFSAIGRFANNTTTNILIEILPSAPVITSPTNWVLQAGVEAQYQIVAGGVGREWAGYDDFSSNTSKWSLSGTGGTTLLTSSGSLANRTTGSNSSQDGLAFWQRLLPRTASWEVWARVKLPTNAPVSGQNFKLGLLLGNQARNNGQVWEVRHFFGEGRYVAQHKRLNTLTDTNKLDVSLGSQPRANYDLALKFTAGDQRLRGFVFDAEGNEVTNQVIALPAGLGSVLNPGIISECNRAPLAAAPTFSADDFLILPDPGDIEYQAFLVDANGAALLDDGGQPYLPAGLFCNPNNGTVEGILAEDFPGGTYRMRVEAIYRPERLPGSSPPIVAGAATIQLRVIPAGQISMEFVPVGNPGNTAFNGAGRGRVDYAYQIGKYKVTVGQYATFLNAVAQSESEGEPPLYSPAMATNANAGGVLRLGDNGSYRYQILGSPDKPAAFVSWQAAARFCNWLVNGQGTNSILTGAYDFSTNSSGHPSGSISKNPNAAFRLPNGNEWFKAAYFDPNKAGTNKYWRYATRSDMRPGNSSLTTANQANFRLGAIYFLTRLGTLDPSQNYLTDVGAFGASASSYGTFDQNGNLDEWIDQLGLGGNDSRLRWGGAWLDDSDARMKSSDYLPASDNGIGSYGQSSHIGFRVVRNPP